MLNLGGATLGLAMLLVLATACAGSSDSGTTSVPFETAVSEAPTNSVERDPDVPQLPFPDNPDPNACGIPTSYGGSTAWVNGVYRGQVVEPTVSLYDSHERIHITGAVPSGTEVQVELYQANPVLDFYFVRAETPTGPQKGWVPAPFLQFSPPPA
jgi:hypothetical protein